MPQPSLKELLTNEWSDEARAAALEARKGKSKGSWLGTAAKTGFIVGGTLAGGVAGAKLAARLLPRGRLLKAGENVVGKVLYTTGGKKNPLTPSLLFSVGKDKTRLNKVLDTAAQEKGIKGLLGKIGQKIDRSLQLAGGHYGVGLEGGKVAEFSPVSGQNIQTVKDFARTWEGVRPNIRVVEEGLVKGTRGKAREAAVKALKRNWLGEILSGKWGKANWKCHGDNCEVFARKIAGLKPISREVRAVKAGLLGGGAVGAATSAGSLYRSRKREATTNAWTDAARAASIAVRRRLASISIGAGGAVAGGAYGGMLGILGGTVAASPGLARLQKKLQDTKNHVDAKEFVAKTEPSIKHLSSVEEIQADSLLTPKEKQILLGNFPLVALGQNAFSYMAGSGKGYVISLKTAPQDVLSHEIGHIRDQRKHGMIKRWVQSPIGMFTGHLHQREKQAWEEGGTRADKDALGSYSKQKWGTRIGTGAGVVGGALYALKMLRNSQEAEPTANELTEMITGKNIPALIQRIIVRPEVSQIVDVINGGPGSGNFGHRGIVGHRGGSLPRSAGAMSVAGSPSASAPSYEAPSRMSTKDRKKYETKTVKQAEILSEHADKMEKTTSRLFGSDENNIRVGVAHHHAYETLERASQQGSVLDDPEKAKSLLDKATAHQKQRDLRFKSAGVRFQDGSLVDRGGASIGKTLKVLGTAFVEGSLGVPPGMLGEALGQYGGKVAKKAAFEGMEGGLEGAKQSLKKQTSSKAVKRDYYASAQRVREKYGLPTDDSVSVALRKVKSGFGSLQKKGVRPASTYEGRSKKGRHSKAELDYIARRQYEYSRAERAASKPRSVPATPEPPAPQSEPIDFKKLTSRIEALQGRLDKLGKKIEPTGSAATEEGFTELQDQPTIHSEISLLIANISGRTRVETLNGREYIVAPVTMIVEGVLNGSKGPLFYPEAEISKDPQAWNGMPIVVNHPMEGGVPVSARSPRVIEKIGIGYIFNSRFNEKKLVAEGWFDTTKVQTVNSQILANLKAGKPIELSTGLFTDNEPFEGTWNGKRYTFIARNYRPDHLAILVGSKGACSVRDGCGVLVNKTEDSQDISQPVADLIRNIGIPRIRLPRLSKIPTSVKAGAGVAAIGGTVAAGMGIRRKYKKALRKATGDIGKKLDAMPLDNSSPVANIIKQIGGKHCVFSHAGRNLGGCGSEEHAKKRLQQVEYFKHKGGTTNEEVISTEVQNVLGAIRAVATTLPRIGGALARGGAKLGMKAGLGTAKGSARVGLKGAKRLAKSKTVRGIAGYTAYTSLPSMMRG